MDAFAESPEWGGALVIFPYMYYETYGDDSLIKKYYQNMRRYVDYLSTRADNHILSFGLGDWYDYGDFRCRILPQYACPAGGYGTLLHDCRISDKGCSHCG